MKYRLVCFDFDGTLADSGPWFSNVLNDLAREFNFKPLIGVEHDRVRACNTKEILQHLGIPMWKLPRIVMRMRKLAFRDREKIRLFPGVDDLLPTLTRNGMEIGIVSSNSEETIRVILGSNAHHINHFACGASMFGKAPRLRNVLRRGRILASQAIYVGDETRDADAANEVGMDFGAVAWGYTKLEALTTCSPTFQFEKVEDIAKALVPRSRSEGLKQEKAAR